MAYIYKTILRYCHRNIWAAFRSKKDRSSTAAFCVTASAPAKAGETSAISRHSNRSDKSPETAAVCAEKPQMTRYHRAAGSQSRKFRTRFMGFPSYSAGWDHDSTGSSKREARIQCGVHGSCPAPMISQETAPVHNLFMIKEAISAMVQVGYYKPRTRSFWRRAYEQILEEAAAGDPAGDGHGAGHGPGGHGGGLRPQQLGRLAEAG